MTSMGSRLTLGVTTPLVAAGAAAVKFAIDAEETAAKFETVFGGATAAVQAELDRMSRTIPMTRDELRGATADLAVLGKAAGLTETEAAKLSTQFVTAAADLGSFNNVPTPEALMAIRSALVGSSEPLLRFGVDTRVASLEAIALEEGLIKEGEAMDAATRAAAVMAAIQKHASDAMGDAARTADSTANSLKFMKRDVIDLATSVGEQLVPILRPLVAQLVEWLGRLKEMDPGMRNAILVVAGLAAALGPVLVVLGTMVSAVGALLPVLGAVVTAIGGVSLAAAAPVVAIGALVAALVLLYTKSETVRDVVNAAFSKMRDVAVAVFGELRDAVGEIARELYTTIDVRFVQPVKVLWAKWGDEIMAVARVVWGTLETIIGTQLAVIWEIIKVAFNTIKEGILLVLNIIQGDWSGAWENIKNIVSGVVGAILGIVDALWEGIKELFRNAVPDVNLTWSGLWEEIKAVPERAQAALEGILRRIFEAIIGIFESIRSTSVTLVKGMWEEIKEVFTGAIRALGDKMREVHETVVGAFQRIKDLVVSRSIWTDMWDEILGVMETGTTGIEGALGEHADRVVGTFLEIKNKVVGKIDEMTGGMLSRLGIGLDDIEGLFRDWKGTLLSIADELTGGLIGKFRSLWSDITGIFSNGFRGFLESIARIVPEVMDIVDTVTKVLAGGTTAAAGASGVAAGGAAVVPSVPIAWGGTGGTAAAGGATTGAVVGGVAGASVALLGPVALSFLGEGLMNLLGRDPGIDPMVQYRRRAEAEAEWLTGGTQLVLAGGGTSYGAPRDLTYAERLAAKQEVVVPVYLDSEVIAEAVAPVLVNRTLYR